MITADKKCNTHGLQYYVMKIYSQALNKYEKDGEYFMERGFWITTINDDEIYLKARRTVGNRKRHEITMRCLLVFPI